MLPSRQRFFPTSEHFRQWLNKNHARKSELWVGFYKKSTRQPSITWPESVDEALCYGWIDGIRKAVDESSYTIRFSPRRKKSVWSAINIRNVQRLIKSGRMQPRGLQAFALRQANRSEIYSYEQRPQELPPSLTARIKRNKVAWQFYQDQPPGYRRQITWWIVSARTASTRDKRLQQLIEMSAKKQRLR